jgi:hypothetical protein
MRISMTKKIIFGSVIINCISVEASSSLKDILQQKHQHAEQVSQQKDTSYSWRFIGGVTCCLAAVALGIATYYYHDPKYDSNVDNESNDFDLDNTKINTMDRFAFKITGATGFGALGLWLLLGKSDDSKKDL